MAGNALELAVAYVSLVPSTNKIAPAVVKEVAKAEGAVAASGKKAGAGYAAGLGGALGGAAKKVFAPLAVAAAGVGVGAFFADAIKGASDLEQSVGAVEAVFKGQAAAIKASAAAASQNLGLTKSQYNDLAATLGALLKNKGIKDFTGQTQNLIGLGADLAAQFGGTTKEAVEALSSALRGETDPIEKYGVSMNDAAIQAQAMAMGLGKPVKNLDQIRLKQQQAMMAQRAYNEAVAKHGKNSDEAVTAEARLMGAQAQLGKAMEGKTQKLTDQQKAMAALALIQKQTSDAQGAAAREQDTYAGRLARLSAAWGDFKATIGSPLIAVLATLMGGLTGVVQAANGLFGSITGGNDKVSVLRSAFDALAASPVGRWFADLGRSIGDVVAPAFQEIGSVITGTLWPALQSLGGLLAGAARAFAGFVAAIVGSPLGAFITTILKGALVGFVQGLADIFKGLVKVVSGAFQAIAGLLTGDWSRMWSGLGQVVVGAIQALWGFLQAGLMGRVLGVFRGFAAVLGQVFGRSGPVGSVFGAFGSFVLGVIEGVAKGFVEFGGTLGRIAGAVIGPAVRAVGTVFGALKGLADTAIKAVVGAFTGMGSKIKGALELSDGAMQAFGRGVQAVWSAVTGAISRAWNTIFGSVLTPMRTTILAVLLTAWNSFRDTIAAAWASITAGTSAAWARILGVFTVLRTWVASTLTAMWNTFKALVAAVWTAGSSSVSTSWTRVLAVFTTLRTWVATTLTGMWNTFRALVATVWTAIAASVSSSWSKTLAVFTTLRTWVSSTLTSMWNTFRSLVATVWSNITTSVSTNWTRILGVFTTLRTWVTSTLSAAWTTLRKQASDAWTAVTSAISTAWTKISGYFTNLKDGTNQVWSFFRAAVKGISEVWGGLSGAIQKPIGEAKSWINSNLIGKMNAALSTVGVKLTVPGLATGGVWDGPGKVTRAATGTVLPGYTPGRDVHQFYSPTGGRLMLSGGEAVMVPEWTRAVGPRLVAMMNALARRGGVRKIREFLFGTSIQPTPTRRGMSTEARHEYASGGIFGRPQRFAGGGILDLFTDPVGAVKSLASSILGGMPGGNFPFELAKGFGMKAVAGIADKVKEFWSSAAGAIGGGGSGSVMGWQRQWAWAQANLPGVRLHSGFRPGARTRGSGSVSYHALGRAIDITPSMPMFNKIKSTFFKNIRELIYSPANSQQVYNGQNHYFANPITRADHWDHVHWAMRRGGVLGNVKLFDQGGLLRRGDVAVHDAVKPDRVLTDAQWQAVMRHIPVSSPTGGFRALTGGNAGVHIHGDVYGDPERFARRITTRMRDELALVELGGV